MKAGRFCPDGKDSMTVGTLEQIRKDMEHGVYDFTVNGECSQCGACCSNLLPVSSKEVKEIHRYVKKHHIQEQKTLIPMLGIALDLTCPFRSETEKKCLIYSVRPQICRSFRCDYPRRHIQMNKEVLRKRYQMIDMRKEFYGGSDDEK